jgi:two-component system response regulator ChvI
MTFPDDDKVRGNILIVDDDDLFRESIARNLSNAGFTPIVFADAASALTHLAASSQPDVILLDWRMPGMTGVELLAELRKAGITTPIMFLTVLGDQIHEEAGLHSGAVDFVEKSRGFSIISHRIGLILSGARAGG